MKIGVDAGCLGINDDRLKVGVYNVAKNILLELGKLDSENEYYLYSFRSIDKALKKKLPSNMKNIVVRPSQGWLKIWLPIRMVRDRIDVFLALSQAMPPRMSPFIRTIGFVYDIAFEKHPDFYPNSYSDLHVNTKVLVKNAAKIVTISKITAMDLERVFHAKKSKITVIPLGSRVFPKAKKMNLGDRQFFLYVGALKRVKNVATVLYAFDRFCQTVKMDYELYLVGGDKWFDPAIKRALEKISEETLEKVTFIGFVDDDELITLYKRAVALVSPSFYEGFGLAHLEAMVAGCPVIASNAGSLPEVVGKAGILVDPQDMEGIADAMRKLSTDKQFREAYVKKGLEKAKKYTWQKSAKELYKLIKDEEKF